MIIFSVRFHAPLFGGDRTFTSSTQIVHYKHDKLQINFVLNEVFFKPCVGKIAQNVFVGYISILIRPLCDNARTVPQVLKYWASRTHCAVTRRYETWLNVVSQEARLAGTIDVQ